jgi:hypothetical protein
MTETALAPRDPMALISAAIAQGMPVSELTGLFELQRQWSADRAAEAFAEALTGFQADCPMVQKTRNVTAKDKSVKYRFAGYEDVMAVARPHLANHKIAHSFSTPAAADGQYVIVCHLRVGSHAEDRPYTCQAPDIKKLAADTYCNEPQAQGSWLSYMKRYAFCGATGVVVCDEDNDAGTVERIKGKHIAEINTLMEKTGISLDDFLKRWKVDSLEDIPLTRFEWVTSELKYKLKEIEKGGKK